MGGSEKLPTASGNGQKANLKIGVFICHCGGNISDVVDVERVAEDIRKLPNVFLANIEMFMRSDTGQATIENAIYEFYEDIRTYGRGHEDMYTKAGDLAVVFVRFDPKRPPVREPVPVA